MLNFIRRLIMKTLSLITALLCLAIAPPDRVAAQDVLPLAFEARIGATLPLTEFESESPQAEAGLAYGASVHLRIVDRVSLYAGYSEHAFGCAGCDSMRGSGFDLGARVEPPAVLGIGTWFRGGAVVHRLRIDRFPGVEEEAITSDRAAGLELGGGAALGVLPGLTATPGVRWVVYPADFPGIAEASRAVNYLLADLGLRLAF